MIRKTAMIGGGVLLASLMLFGRNTLGYIRTSMGYVRESVHNSVPVGFEIDRARDMIKDLTPEVRNNMHLIAKEEVDIKRLEEQVAATEARLAKEKEQILRLKTDLAAGKPVLQYAGRDYTPDEVKADLANRFERFKTGEATLASLRKIRQARERSLTAARQKLEGMLAERRRLQVEVENLEARHQMVAAAQTTSNYQFEDSRLGQAKELVSDLQTRLEVAEKLAGAESEFQGEIPLDRVTPQNIVQQVSEYFRGPDAKAVAKAGK